MAGSTKKDKKVAVTGPPIEAPTKFKMTGAFNRTTLVLTVTWEYPKSATDKKSANRWEGTVIYLATDTNTKDNVVQTSTLLVGEKGYTAWKGKKKDKKKNLQQLTKKEGKIKKDAYKGATEKNKVKDVAKSTVSLVVLDNHLLYKGTSKKSWKKNIDLTKFYPTASKTFLDGVVCKLQGYNQYSLPIKTSKTKKKKNGKTVTTNTATVKFDKDVPWSLYQVSLDLPSKPVIEQNYVQELRRINFKVTAAQPGNGKHWYRTDWTMKATKSFVDPETKANTTTILDNLSGSSDTLVDNKYYSLTPGNFIDMNSKVFVKFTATAKGAHGSSAINDSSYGEWTFAYPHQKSITGGVEQIGESDLVTITFSNDSTVDNTNRYTSSVWLERLPDFMVPERMILTATDDDWKSQAARSTGWEKVGGEFHPSVGKFVRSYNMDRAGLSSPYSRTLYRVGAKNASFDADEYYVYSTPEFLPGYSTIPKPSNDTIDFLECVPEKNGTSVRVAVAYHVSYEDGNPTSDGCEISWSDDYNSWKSNNPPSTFDMPDLDNLGVEYYRVKKPETVSPVSDDMYRYWLIPDSWDAAKKTEKYTDLTGSKGSGYREFTFVSKSYVMGLTEGVKYYFRARRYLEETSDLPRLYGPYADYSSNLGYEDAAEAAKLVQPSTTPENVKLKVTSPVPVGKDLELVWTFEGDGTQTEWELKRYTADEVTEGETNREDSSKTWKLKETAVGVVAKTSKDAAGYTLLPYNTTYNDDGSVKELGISEYLEDNLVYFVVGAKTTGDFGYSAPVQVRYVEPPDAALGVSPILMQQPMCLSIGSNIGTCSATVKISALDSTTRQGPEGLRTQPEGYTVYSNKFEAANLHWTPNPGLSEITSQTVSDWSDTVPDYNENYPDYYRSYEYVESGTTKWTVPELDRPMSEIKLLGSVVSDPILLWYAGTSDSVPQVPVPVDTSQQGYSEMNPQTQGWCEKHGVEDNRYYVATSDTAVSEAHVYYELCGLSNSTAHSTWTSTLPTYDSEHPVYYYCYRYRISDYDSEDRYAWTSVSVDTGMTNLRASGISVQGLTTLWKIHSGIEYFSNLMLPRPLELLDGARYQVSLVLEDPETKLDSMKPDADGVNQPMTSDFSVSYSRTASVPNANHVFVFSNQESLTTSIQIVKPELHVPGDVYDIYRVTPDGITNIGANISPGQVIQDSYAPFSSDRNSFSDPTEKAVNLRYRVTVRTPDGTEAWRDFLYSLKSPSIRFDWGGVNAPLMEYTSLTIPYNLTYSDTFKKYFEARHHMDDRLPVGFWTTSIDRTSSISTDIIKYDNPRDKEALKSLSGYSGPVFVRRPDGCAYLANVELNSYSVAYNAEVIPVSFDIVEIELTDEYMIAEGSYIANEDRIALENLSVEPEGFYDNLLVELKNQ